MTDLRLYDNTRLNDFRRCPRYFYYRHVRHWSPEGTALPLVFGAAWHAAQDVIWQELPRRRPRLEVIALAQLAFEAEWTAAGLPSPRDMSYELEKEYSPRTPANALEMIAGYVEHRAPLLEGGDVEVISIEKPLIIPLDRDDKDLYYIGKMDKIVRNRGRILGIEHKTTTLYAKQGKFRGAFLDSFSPNSQVYGYIYGLTMAYPDEKVQGVWVDAALVHKTDEGFTFIPVEVKHAQLDMWLWETRQWIAEVEANKAALSQVTPDQGYMPAFPRRTIACFDYNKACPFLPICRAKPNPHFMTMPPGFIEEVWDPVKHLNISELAIQE